MKGLSLFSGIGGLDLAFEWAGGEVVAQCEIDPFCQKVLQKHWPNVRMFDDVRDITSRNAPRHAIIIGGFPCKQTSTAAAISGGRKGLGGKDSGLWGEQLRVIADCLPAWVVVENPVGVQSWEAEIRNSLESLGYVVRKAVNKASDFGAPHQRKRVFFIAYRRESGLEGARPDLQAIADAAGPTTAPGAWLHSITGVLRVDERLASRVDRRERITAIGNAVVPQQAYPIFKAIMEAS